jgi:hypothetical protein
MWTRASAVALVSLTLSGTVVGVSAQEAGGEEHEAQIEAEDSASSSVFRVGSFRSWIFRSFMVDEGDDALTLGLEFESYLGLGGYQVKNIAYIELDDFPRAIPGQPPGNPEPDTAAVTGVSDLLTGFWVSRQGRHHGKHHFAPGLAMQFPTASSETLGSGKWSIGPSFDYEYESGSLFAGAIALQIWSFAGDSDRKDVSMLMIKPFVYYALSDRFDLMYVPYGISVYWNKPSGEKMYLPIGGGAQYKTHLGSLGLNLGAQLFNNVVRPTKGTVWDLRFLVELVL